MRAQSIQPRIHTDSTEVNRHVLLTLLSLPKEQVHEKAPKPERLQSRRKIQFVVP